MRPGVEGASSTGPGRLDGTDPLPMPAGILAEEWLGRRSANVADRAARFEAMIDDAEHEREAIRAQAERLV
jgi:hypothetical protein